MADYTQTDWYRFPFYYDVVFDNDTPVEADFLEAVLARHGVSKRRSPAHILEPACGNGRLVAELVRRGHRVAGFDASAEMIRYAKDRIRREPPATRKRARLTEARMESFRLRGPFDLVHCLLSTFKYLLTEAHALAHLERVARVLAPGGVYVLAIHLTDYNRRHVEKEVWRGERGGVKVVSETVTQPPASTTRLEWLRNRLQIRRPGTRSVEKLETHWQCRTYDAAELEALLARVPTLEPVACYDFTHDIDTPRGLDDTQEDLIVILRKRRIRQR